MKDSTFESESNNGCLCRWTSGRLTDVAGGQIRREKP